MLMESRDGYVLWNTTGAMIDHNSAFGEITGLTSEANVFELEFVQKKPDSGPVPVPESVFQGKVIETFIAVSSTITGLIRLNAWPVTDDQGQIIAALGRIEPAKTQEYETNESPEHLWGLKLSSELHKRRATQVYPGLESLIGHGPNHSRMLRQIQAAIKSKCPIVIAGEPGTGRHHLARVIHGAWQKGAEKRSGLVPLDPLSLPSEILARDFLGVTPGKSPSWNVPEGSTVLIEGLGGLDVNLQLAILAASGGVQLIGIVNSHEDLQGMVPEFRAMIDVLLIETIPLRARVGELPLLAQSVLERLCESTGRRVDGLTAPALELLQHYDWPGNWRDLEKVLREAIAVCTGPMISADHIPSWIQGSFGGAWMKTPQTDPSGKLEDVLVQTRREAVQQAVRQFGDNKAAVARALGISRPKLYRILAELGLDEGLNPASDES